MEPTHQQHWDWKAAGNFICGGAGAGLFACVAAAGLYDDRLLPLGWAALALVALGLFLVLLKIGRPARFAYVLRQPQRSWMAREAWIATAFFPLAAVATWLEAPPQCSRPCLSAFCSCSARRSSSRRRGFPAWRTPAIVPLIGATGLVEGAGLLLLAAALLGTSRAFVEMTATAAVVLAALGWSWRSYLGALANDGAPTRTLAVLHAFRPWFLGFGLVLPMVLVVAGIVATSAAALLFAIAGLSLVGVGGALKFILVTRAGYNQGFALAHTPVRGSGVAGPAIKPGWSTS